jgi:hypothetical protein
MFIYFIKLSQVRGDGFEKVQKNDSFVGSGDFYHRDVFKFCDSVQQRAADN